MDLTQSLFEWVCLYLILMFTLMFVSFQLKTFDSVSNYRSAKDLCDGVAIAHVLNQM